MGKKLRAFCLYIKFWSSLKIMFVKYYFSLKKEDFKGKSSYESRSKTTKSQGGQKIQKKTNRCPKNESTKKAGESR